MKSGVIILVLLATVTCVLTQEEQNAVEELLVETLVSSLGRICNHVTTLLPPHLEEVVHSRNSGPFIENPATSTFFLFCYFLFLDSARNLHGSFSHGRHSANPLYGKKETHGLLVLLF